MRTATGALINFLRSRTPCWKADFFSIILLGGTVYNWTDFDQPLVASGITYTNQGAMLQRSQLGVKNTVEVPELHVKLSALDTDFIGGANVKAQIHNGIFDGASIKLNRVFMPTPGDTSLGPVLLFGGRMSSAKVNAVGAELVFKGSGVLFNQMVPRNLYQAPCLHTFCDPGCTLLAASSRRQTRWAPLARRR
jgi:hypothetical protein